jgi:hypothetical protein
MKSPKPTKNETQRLEKLKEYNVLDTLAEQEYDDITLLASQICNELDEKTSRYIVQTEFANMSEEQAAELRTNLLKFRTLE